MKNENSSFTLTVVSCEWERKSLTDISVISCQLPIIKDRLIQK